MLHAEPELQLREREREKRRTRSVHSQGSRSKSIVSLNLYHICVSNVLFANGGNFFCGIGNLNDNLFDIELWKGRLLTEAAIVIFFYSSLLFVCRAICPRATHL
eukprot:TRINITY_DN101317_c0_g1_i1.p1 TRINITY_DN101317_c0_g1~~TRINITY_DN101317_c0_g1_i1.p1  ORF type:complete len:104 (-),score=15.07 TRINITY_DN101317_c0_g1_i1:48-359(-)